MLETYRLGIGDEAGDLAAGYWKQRWRPSSWGTPREWGPETTLETKCLEVEKTLETERLRIGDEAGGLAPGEWRRHCRLSGWGLETTVETTLIGIGNDGGELAARKGDDTGDLLDDGWGLGTTVET